MLFFPDIPVHSLLNCSVVVEFFFSFFLQQFFLWPNDKQKIAHGIIIISGKGYILNKIK